jgi:hypothetical protein
VAITFDGATARIILDSASTSAAEIWSRWVDWYADNSHWPPAMRQAGGDDLGGGLSIPPYIFLLNGWRVRPMESTHLLVITGNLFVDGGGQPVVPTLGSYNVSVQYTVPVQAQGISTTGAAAPTVSDIWSSAEALGLINRSAFADKVLRNSKLLEKAGSTWYVNIYDDDGVTMLLSKPLKDFMQQEISDLAEGVLASEMASVI